MTTPNSGTRDGDKYKRQLHILEFYIAGRIKQLTSIASRQPGEAAACEMAISELQTMLTQVLPQMREVQS